MSMYDDEKVNTIETIEVSHTSDVSGGSKFIFVDVAVAGLRDGLVDQVARARSTMIIMMRITKIQTSSCTWTSGLVDREEDEDDQRDAGDAVGLEAVGASGRPSRPRCRPCSRR